MSSNTYYERQREFHQTLGHPISDEPGFPDCFTDEEETFVMQLGLAAAAFANLPSKSRLMLRAKLMAEEFAELFNAYLRGDIVEAADALGDISVIAAGDALEFGIDLDVVGREIHRANMSKMGEDGKPIHREDGKIMKGPNYTPPDIEKIITAARSVA